MYPLIRISRGLSAVAPHTLQVAVDALRDQANRTGYHPTEMRICVAVLKEEAQKVDVPELFAVAMLAGKGDWVVGLSDSHRGFDLDDRFAYELPGLYHIELASGNQ